MTQVDADVLRERGVRADNPALQAIGPGLGVGLDRDDIGSSQSQSHPKRRTLIGNAMNRNRALHQLHEHARNRKTKTAAAETACRRCIGLRERFEQAPERFFVDADSVVRDDQIDSDCVGVALDKLTPHRHLTPVCTATGKLDCVADQVDADLAKPALIGNHRPRYRWIDEHGQADTPLDREMVEHAAHLLDRVS